MGMAKTLARVQDNFTWNGIKEDVKKFVQTCVDCQHTKYDNRKPVGLLNPLPVSLCSWEDLYLEDWTTLQEAYHLEDKMLFDEGGNVRKQANQPCIIITDQ